MWNGLKRVWDLVHAGIEISERQGIECARWKHEKSGMFSTCSAYASITQEDTQVNSFWRNLWKVEAPERCITHMWLLAQDRLLTNKFKYRCNIHDIGDCSSCPYTQETTLHVSRDCAPACSIWYGLGISNSDLHFWQSNLDDLILMNMRKHDEHEGIQWKIIFYIACLILWRRRNERVHHGSTSSIRKGLVEILGIARCMKLSPFLLKRHQFSFSKKNYEVNEVGGQEESWNIMKVNGAFSLASRDAGCGGALLNKEGNVIEAFSCNINCSSSFEAELWDVWDLGEYGI